MDFKCGPTSTIHTRTAAQLPSFLWLLLLSLSSPFPSPCQMHQRFIRCQRNFSLCTSTCTASSTITIRTHFGWPASVMTSPLKIQTNSVTARTFITSNKTFDLQIPKKSPNKSHSKTKIPVKRSPLTHTPTLLSLPLRALPLGCSLAWRRFRASAMIQFVGSCRVSWSNGATGPKRGYQRFLEVEKARASLKHVFLTWK